ncbi:MAG: small ribosomal subunit Rsm22 family protein [Desulfovibrionaceae bacterium]
MSHDYAQDFLFPRLGDAARAELDRLPAALRAALNLRPRHQAQLPADIHRLSTILTSERADRPRGYLTDPHFSSAYLHYFLPWNLLRLMRLLSSRPFAPVLDLPDGAVVADLGSGPLTLPLALWMCRPELRARRLNFVCVDAVPKVMRLGLEIFRRFSNTAPAQGDAPDSGHDAGPWRITLVKGGVGMPLRERPDLLCMVNVLNEMDTGMARMAGLAQQLARQLAPAGRLLVVEPGVRRSAQALALLREELLEYDLLPELPCPHQEPECAMPGLGRGAWCHFTFDAEGAPEWLTDLAAASGLPKHGLSLSFLLASARAKPTGGARVVSAPFTVPGGVGLYACTDRGQALLRIQLRDAPPPSGALRPTPWPEAPQKDPKSGAWILPLERPGRPETAPVPEIPDPAAPAEAPKPPTRPAPKSPARPGPRPGPKPGPKPGPHPKSGPKPGPKPGSGPKPKPKSKPKKDRKP